MGKNLTCIGRTERFGVTTLGLWEVGDSSEDNLIQGQEGGVYSLDLLACELEPMSESPEGLVTTDPRGLALPLSLIH